MPTKQILSNYRLSRPAWLLGSPAYVITSVYLDSVTTASIRIKVNQAYQYPILGGEIRLNEITDAFIRADVNGSAVPIVPTSGVYTNIPVPSTEYTQDITSKILTNQNNTIKILFNTMMGGGVDIWLDAYIDYEGNGVNIVVEPYQPTNSTLEGLSLLFSPAFFVLLVIIVMMWLFRDIKDIIDDAIRDKI